MKPIIKLKTTTLLFIPLVLACFALLPGAQAVTPAPDGGYANFNTAEGQSALASVTTGTFDTAIGAFSLNLVKTTSDNTAVGTNALRYNTGSSNTAAGSQALRFNTTGSDNAAFGAQALFNNSNGLGNNAFGHQALYSNSTGTANVAVGNLALFSLTDGDWNVAVGTSSLIQSGIVNFNTALGYRALYRCQGDQNIGLGIFAGSNLNDGGTNNIYVGNVGPVPIGSESNTIRLGTQTATTATIGNPPSVSHPMPAHTATYIAGIYNESAVGGSAVYVTSDGKLGTITAFSSQRFKDEIKPMGNVSEAILALKPVTFRYKKEIEPSGIPQFGLVAEEVEKVASDLVVRDAEGKAYTVRYDAVNAMLLNEFLKEHRKVEDLKRDFQATIAQQQKQIEALTAGLQKVSAQIEVSKPAPQTVLNNQ
jgi:hypothetical protein